MEQSFISGARRKQIAQATINTLDELGFANSSLAQIAKRAGISTALISYHFENKHALMTFTLVTLLEDVAAFVLQRCDGADSERQKLHAYIEANLDYRASHPAHYTALLEILFNGRTTDGIPYYRLEEDEDDKDPLLDALQQILKRGQEGREFAAFDVTIMAHTIQGAIWEYVTSPALVAAIHAADYAQQLIAIFEKGVLAPTT